MRFLHSVVANKASVGQHVESACTRELTKEQRRTRCKDSVRSLTQVYCHFSESVERFPLKPADLYEAPLQRRRHVSPLMDRVTSRAGARAPRSNL